MIFNLNKAKYEISRRKGLRLFEIGWKEEDFQRLMYENLDVLLPEDELLLIMQSRRWQEEPDLMAIDRNGDLFIFELKAWESQDANLLQVMRYGQIFGQYSYGDLNDLFLKFFPNEKSLLGAINRKFNTEVKEADVNQKQQFVLITNGLDFKTRAAIEYWAGQGVKISSWIYKLYELENQTLLEFETYRKNPNPYEDIDEGYYILNTNSKDGDIDDNDMLNDQKAAAFFEPWKFKIEQLKKGDKVFLYRSGTGIIAKGIATGELIKKAYRDNPEHPNEEYSMKLNKFRILDNPIAASEIKKIAGVNYVFMQTMFSIDKETGEKLWDRK
ncbi:MAG: EVE domain-containing protein [Lewinellaceae bacterium]|nr:EVE domain-containing protein [Lewinellaceae bacterium]